MIKVLPERVCGSPVNIGSFIPYDQLKDAIMQEGIEAGLPITLEDDQLKVGKGVIGLAAKAEPCIVIYHSHHRKDYYHYILTESMQGNLAFLIQYLGGDSKNFKNEVLTKAVGGVIGNMIGGLTGKKQQEENMFYDAVNAIILRAIESL